MISMIQCNKYTGFILLLLLTMKSHAYSMQYDTDEITQKYSAHVPTNQTNLTLSSSVLLTDTRGPAFSLSLGTAIDRVIRGIDNALGYYITSDCSGSNVGHVADTTSSSFTFSDDVPMYFGQTALSALSNNNPEVQCIYVVLSAASPR